MQSPHELENKLVEEACSELKKSGEISDALRGSLVKSFGDRYSNGLELVNTGKVRKYEFRPSGRVVWAVQGRKGEYQVIPDIPFCYCDDYYFRVMDKKRGLCYHIIAQRFAEALNKYQAVNMQDYQYSTITARWRAKDEPGE